MENNSTDSDDSTWKINIISPISFLPVLEEVLYAHSSDDFPALSDFEIEGDNENRLLEGYFNNPPDQAILITAINQMADIFNLPAPSFTLDVLGDENWVAASQKILKPIDAGHFFVYGSHDAKDIPKDKISILMEAGQAFGTGSHGTTKGCLLAIYDHANEITPNIVLDLGCGSGVLAIAMAKQWKSKIIASDIDPIATETAAENVIMNKVNTITPGENNDGIAIVTCDGFSDTVIEKVGPYDLIVANILAAPLKFLANDIVRNIRQNGSLILSGLLDIQETDIISVYKNEGMELIRSYPIKEWRTLLLKKKI